MEQDKNTEVLAELVADHKEQIEKEIEKQAISQPEIDAEKLTNAALTESNGGPALSDAVRTMVTFFMKPPIAQIQVGTDINYESVKRLINSATKQQRFVTIPSPTDSGKTEEISINLDEVIVWSAAKFNNSKIIQPNMGPRIIK